MGIAGAIIAVIFAPPLTLGLLALLLGDILLQYVDRDKKPGGDAPAQRACAEPDGRAGGSEPAKDEKQRRRP